ncbi:MAG: peptidoglycan-binding protein [Alphaproteobacteria bacterium]|nr:peptidoglycan-binding protein [Alphaproteobacteria bacterium]
MSTDAQRLRLLASDGNLDIEDVALAVEHALADGRISPAEARQIDGALSEFGERMEPAARDYLLELVRGKAPKLVNRVLLAPHPAGEPPDLYYARVEVVALQEALDRLGYDTAIDGLYGPGTARSVSDFQVGQGMSPSGQVDSRTLHRLNRALDKNGLPLLDLNPRARIRPDAVISALGAGDRETNKALQRALNDLKRHYVPALERVREDGDFGPKTEAALRQVQAAALLPASGILDTATAEALNLMLAAAGRALLDVHPPTGGAGAAQPPVELHFYPGPEEHVVYVMRGGRAVESYGMVGGEPQARDDANSEIDFSPTPEGRYEVVRVDPHASFSWPLSYVPYGSQLQERAGEIWFRDGDGEWLQATGAGSIFGGRTPPAPPAAYYRRSDGTLPPTYTNNQFGHLRALLRDLQDGRVQSHMIHSSPYTELTRHYFADTGPLTEAGAAASLLRTSHGCEHIHPRDLDEMIAKGYLAPGTVFVVHGYDERFGGRALS